jgi:hypothetical protein
MRSVTFTNFICVVEAGIFGFLNKASFETVQVGVDATHHDFSLDESASSQNVADSTYQHHVQDFLLTTPIIENNLDVGETTSGCEGGNVEACDTSAVCENVTTSIFSFLIPNPGCYLPNSGQYFPEHLSEYFQLDLNVSVSVKLWQVYLICTMSSIVCFFMLMLLTKQENAFNALVDLKLPLEKNNIPECSLEKPPMPKVWLDTIKYDRLHKSILSKRTLQKREIVQKFRHTFRGNVYIFKNDAKSCIKKIPVKRNSHTNERSNQSCTPHGGNCFQTKKTGLAQRYIPSDFQNSTTTFKDNERCCI